MRHVPARCKLTTLSRDLDDPSYALSWYEPEPARARDLSFAWRDGERLIRFGRGVAAEAVERSAGPAICC